MPKLLFTPVQHNIETDDEANIFITSKHDGEPVICCKCNELAAFIINQMYPEHKPRTEIIKAVLEQYPEATEKEATEAVNGVINILTGTNKSTEGATE